MDDADWTAEIS